MGVHPVVDGDYERLLERAKQPDMDAYGMLFERERALIENKVRQSFRNKQDINDVMQETFVKGYNGITTFRGESKLSSWLCEIALNVCKENLRKESVHPAESLDGSFPEEKVRSRNENPLSGRTRRGGKIERFSAFRRDQNEELHEFEIEELRPVLRSVLDELDPEEREAMKLCFFQHKRILAGKVALSVGFSTRTKIYETTRKYVGLCRIAIMKLRASRKAVQPVERSP